MTFDPYNAAILRFGGEVKNPCDFLLRHESNLETLDAYLVQVGVEHFTAQEICKPRYPDKAVTPYNIPHGDYMSRAGALCMLSEVLRKKTGDRAVNIYNWFRPAAYNLAVGGAADSDHLRAEAFDMWFAGNSKVEQRTRQDVAVAYLKSLQTEEPWLKLHIRDYKDGLHVGLFPKNGQRFYKEV